MERYRKIKISTEPICEGETPTSSKIPPSETITCDKCNKGILYMVPPKEFIECDYCGYNFNPGHIKSLTDSLVKESEKLSADWVNRIKLACEEENYNLR